MGIQDLLTLSLVPKKGEPPECYAVEDDLVHAQSRYLGTILHAMGQSIVPIVSIADGQPHGLGTGFFVSTTGLLITAAHVLSDYIRPQDGELGVLLRGNKLLGESDFRFVPLEWGMMLAREEENPLPFAPPNIKFETDTAICKIMSLPNGEPHQPLSIIQPGIRGTGLASGKKATAIGYGSMQDLGGKFALHVSKGNVLEHFPDNRTRREAPAPGACFTASLRLPSGMSGSPIFDDEGIYVHGVVSRGYDGENYGYGTMLAESINLPIPPLGGQSLSQLLKSGEHGMAQLSIPGA